MEQFFKNISDKIWNTASLPADVARLVLAVLRDFREGVLTLRATSLVYTTILSFAPLLAISFSVLKGLGVHNQIEPFLKNLLQPLGNQSADVVARIISFVDNIQVGVLGAIGVALLLYSVMELMGKIEAAFNDIWRVSNKRFFALRFRDYLTVILIGPLLMFLSVAMTASLKHATLIDRWLGIDIIGTALEKVFLLVPYILFTFAFAAIYMLLPNVKVRIIPALISGFIAGVLWKCLGFLFGIFVAGSASYTAIYSAFATLLIFMIWLYMGWLVVLMGASCCYYLQNPSNRVIPRSFKALSLQSRFRLALKVVSVVGADFYKGEIGYTSDELAMHLNLPEIVVSDLVRDLKNEKLLHVVQGTQKIIPAVPFDVTTVKNLFDAVATEEGEMPLLEALPINQVAQHVLQDKQVALQKALSKYTLKSLCEVETKV